MPKKAKKLHKSKGKHASFPKIPGLYFENPSTTISPDKKDERRGGLMTSTRLQSSFFNKSYIMTQKLMLLLCCYLWSLTQGASIAGKALTECTTQPAKCLNLGQNWTSTYNDVNTRLGCNQRCIEHDLCTT